MMGNETYIEYLEHLAMSLMVGRDEYHEIECVATSNTSLQDASFSPVNAKQMIGRRRDLRGVPVLGETP